MRVTDMRSIDLTVFRFDYDLTFAMLVMNADGTIYHQYGNRDPSDPQSHLSEVSLARLLRDALPEHEAYQKSPEPPPRTSPVAVEDLPRWARQLASGKPIECFHCHMIGEAFIDADRVPRADATPYPWQWPSSSRIGLTIDRDDQQLINEVGPTSPAAAAGLVAGDRITKLAGRTILTEGDLQAVLEETPEAGAKLPYTALRKDAARTGTIKLTPGWKLSDFRDVAWRSSIWPLSPKPGFGGPALGAGEKKKHGLSADALAFRVNYIVTWGPNAHTGRSAAKAGIRKGDIVISVDGRADFASVKEFHTWFRLTREVGKTAEVELIRKGKRLKLELPLLE